MRQTTGKSFSRSQFYPYQIAVIFLLTLFIVTCACYPNSGYATGNIDTESQAVEKVVADRNFAQLSHKTTELSLKLLDMRAELKRLMKVDTVNKRFDELSQDKTKLEDQLKQLEVGTSYNLQKLLSVENELARTRLKVELAVLPVVNSIAKSDKWIDYWRAEEQDSLQWEKGLGPSSTLHVVQNKLNQFQTVFDDAQTELDTYLVPLLEVQNKADNLLVALHKIDLEIDTIFESKSGLNHRTPPLFSKAFVNQLDANLWHETLQNAGTVLRPDLNYLKPYTLQCIFAIFLFFFIYGSIYRIRQILLQSSDWMFLALRPFSLATLISLTTFIILCRDIGTLWEAIYRAIILICLWRLSGVLFKNDHRKKVINWLILLLFITYLFVLISMPMVLERLYIVAASIATIGIMIFYHRSDKLAVHRRVWMMNWLSLGFVVPLTIVILAEIIGKSDLAYQLFAASLKTLLALLTVWILYLCITGLFKTWLLYSPLLYLRNNAEQIFKMIHPLLHIMALLVLCISIPVIWHIYPTGYVALESLGRFGFTIGANRISLGVVISAIAVLYLAYCISRLVEITLLNTILPHRNIDRGSQVAIARLYNYAIILIGFLAALMTLGFNMTNLTILGGAVGVGIGFGLQAIFNNFASGLILLFERPIKIGDVIMVGDELGEVKKLGLRATVIKTLNHAEIVVPNSDLITNQVTNWTLQQRQVRVKVPIGVAYGSDVEQILKILIDCALEHPQVLSEPKPSALFVSHGPSSLDFELRAFVPDIDERPRICSELNLAINSAFADAGIEIPFQQRDLHLKTVSHEVQNIISEKIFSQGNKNNDK